MGLSEILDHLELIWYYLFRTFRGPLFNKQVVTGFWKQGKLYDWALQTGT
jgi:hypothetical protein